MAHRGRMLHIEEFATPVWRLSREAFAARYPHPFLVLRLAEAQEMDSGWRFRTETLSSFTPIPDLQSSSSGEVALQAGAAHYRVFPVRKREGSALKDAISMGRARNNDVVLPDASVSKLHAHISAQDAAVLVSDLGSRNGTHINGDALQAHTGKALKSGDTLTVGRLELQFLDVEAFYDFVRSQILQES